MTKVHNLEGCKFGRLTVVSRSESSKRGRARWNCVCDCGNEITTEGSPLLSGATKSCGCLRSEKSSERWREALQTHGLSKTRLYRLWAGMKHRCSPNARDKEKRLYFNKGITVCDEWQEFMPFYEWSITNGYAEGLTIDRIDGSKGYSPDNCRWTDYKTQNRNRSNVHLVEYAGERKSLSEWCELLNLDYVKTKNKLRYMNFEEAVKGKENN